MYFPFTRVTMFGALTASALATVSLPAVAQDAFSVTSPDVTEGATITDAQYWNNFGCTGENARPALDWTGAPEGTQSFAVTFYDKDAPTGSGFWHWVVYNIPADATGIEAAALPAGAIEGNTDVGVPGYAGPCPPVGRTHNYVYTVHALGTEKIEVPEGATAALTGFFLYQNTLATATIDVVAGPRSE